MLRQAILTGILFIATVVGCQVDDIVVEVFGHDQAIVVHLQYEGSQMPVALTDIVIQDSNNGSTVWELKSYDPSIVLEKRHEHFDFDKLKQLPIQSVVVSEFRLGNVPDGFKQYFPLRDEKPMLSVEKEYEILVVGAGHRGRAKFKM